MNVAGRAVVPVGLVNYADEAEAPIGLINWIGNGYRAFGVWSSDTALPSTWD